MAGLPTPPPPVRLVYCCVLHPHVSSAIQDSAMTDSKFNVDNTVSFETIEKERQRLTKLMRNTNEDVIRRAIARLVDYVIKHGEQTNWIYPVRGRILEEIYAAGAYKPDGFTRFSRAIGGGISGDMLRIYVLQATGIDENGQPVKKLYQE